MIKNGLIVILILLSLFLFEFRIPTTTVAKTKIDTLTTTKVINKYIKGDDIPYEVLDTIYTDTNVYDTSSIIQDYIQVKEYTDSIKQDSNLFVIKDTISQNRIIGRSFQAKIQEKTITITNNIQAKSKSELYIGFRSDIRQDMSRVNYNISLSFKTRQRGLFSVGYGMSGYSVGYAIKL
jgi:hypothetical protein